jgi:alpha-tubulin suppressor-like RCC1 family protein
MTEERAAGQSNHARRPVRTRILWLLAASGVTLALLWLFLGIANPSVPAISIGPKRIKPQIVVSGDRVLLLAPDGSLWTWGQGSGPHRLGMESDWQAIAASFQAFVGLKTNGSLWQWKNSVGFEEPPRELSPAHDWRAVAAKNIGFAALKADGTLWSLDGSPVQLDESTNWVAVAGMNDYLAAVRGDGTLWVCGLASALGVCRT